MAMETEQEGAQPLLEDSEPQAAPSLLAQGVQLFISSARKDLPHAERKGACCGRAQRGQESRAGTQSWHSTDEGI